MLSTEYRALYWILIIHLQTTEPRLANDDGTISLSTLWEKVLYPIPIFGTYSRLKFFLPLIRVKQNDTPLKDKKCLSDLSYSTPDEPHPIQFCTTIYI